MPRSEVISVGALTMEFLVEGTDSDGSVSQFVVGVPEGARVPAPHFHDAYEETLFGLEGTVTWTVGGEEHRVGPGEALCIRRGVVHGFTNPGPGPARQLVTVAPGVLGPDFFRELGAVVAAAADGPPDQAAIGAVMRRHGLTPAAL